MRIGLIGPTDLGTLAEFIQMPVETIEQKAAQIGKIVAKSGHELWVNIEDKGVLLAAARAYKQRGGRKLVVLSPQRGEPWPLVEGREMKALADEILPTENWFFANYWVVSRVDVVICAGQSPGTLGELKDLTWDTKLDTGVLRTLVAIKELLRGKKLVPEIEQANKDKLVYIDTVGELPGVLRGISDPSKEPDSSA